MIALIVPRGEAGAAGDSLTWASGWVWLGAIDLFSIRFGAATEEQID